MYFDYEIAGKKIRFISEMNLVENEHGEKFRCENEKEPQICCHLIPAEQLPKPSGRVIKSVRDVRIYDSGEKLLFATIERKENMTIFVAEYEKKNGQEMQLWLRDDLYPHTLRIQAIWSAMDLPYQLLKQNVLTLHSASIDVKGETILFMAPSGTGKSTQARLWEEFREARQLNGDKNVIFQKEGKYMAGGVPFCGTSHICENYELPLKCIVLLKQAKENRIQRLTGLMSMKAIFENCFGHQNVMECMEKITHIASLLLKEIPIYELACTPDEHAIECLEKMLQEN